MAATWFSAAAQRFAREPLVAPSSLSGGDNSDLPSLCNRHGPYATALDLTHTALSSREAERTRREKKMAHLTTPS